MIFKLGTLKLIVAIKRSVLTLELLRLVLDIRPLRSTLRLALNLILRFGIRLF